MSQGRLREASSLNFFSSLVRIATHALSTYPSACLPCSLTLDLCVCVRERGPFCCVYTHSGQRELSKGKKRKRFRDFEIYSELCEPGFNGVKGEVIKVACFGQRQRWRQFLLRHSREPFSITVAAFFFLCSYNGNN